MWRKFSVGYLQANNANSSVRSSIVSATGSDTLSKTTVLSETQAERSLLGNLEASQRLLVRRHSGNSEDCFPGHWPDQWTQYSSPFFQVNSSFVCKILAFISQKSSSWGLLMPVTSKPSLGSPPAFLPIRKAGCPVGPFSSIPPLRLWVHATAGMLSHVRPWPLDCSPPGSSVHGDSPGKNTGVGCHFLLQGIFPTQGWNPRLLTPVSSALQVDLLSFKPFEECCKNINRREEKCSP